MDEIKDAFRRRAKEYDPDKQEPGSYYIEILKILRKANLKIIPKCGTIIRFFLQNRRYFTPEEVRTALEGDFEHLELPIIYRNLRELEDIGTLLRITQPIRRFYDPCALWTRERSIIMLSARSAAV